MAVCCQHRVVLFAAPDNTIRYLPDSTENFAEQRRMLSKLLKQISLLPFSYQIKFLNSLQSNAFYVEKKNIFTNNYQKRPAFHVERLFYRTRKLGDNAGIYSQ
jgi:hypothetical protein